MFTKEEQDFVNYWKEQRLKKKQFLRKLSIGLPLGVLLAGTVLINLLSGWYKRADMEVRSNSSLIIVIIIALLGIVVFITIFSARHRFDQNEQQYLELMAKKEKETNDLNNKSS